MSVNDTLIFRRNLLAFKTIIEADGKSRLDGNLTKELDKLNQTLFKNLSQGELRSVLCNDKNREKSIRGLIKKGSVRYHGLKSLIQRLKTHHFKNAAFETHERG